MNAAKKSVMAIAIGGAFASAWANPAGPAVVSGAALLSNPSANVMQIVNTPGTIIQWQGFSIGAGETTRFVQLNAASAVLNRVVTANPSNILGRLESNGRVFLVNPNGIVFGAGAVVDVAGLIASTRDISNANFRAGNYLFNGAGNGAITVQSGARILTSTYGAGGQVWLFAKNVTQEAGSTITAPQGQVVLAAGSTVQVATAGNGNMLFNVTTDGANTVDSLGTIAAERGGVGLFADFVNHRGTINAGNQGSVSMNATTELRIQGASAINAPDGSITLRGGSLLEVEHDSVINADGANGRISFESNNLLVYPSGNTHAVGGQVTFRQDQPTQYLEGGVQTPWVAPTGFRDTNAIVYRAANGTLVVRFQRIDNSDGEDSYPVGVFEVVLDGRTGALVSGPTLVSVGSIEAGAYRAAVSKLVSPNTSFEITQLRSTFDSAVSAAAADEAAANAVTPSPSIETRTANRRVALLAEIAADQAFETGRQNYFTSLFVSLNATRIAYNATLAQGLSVFYSGGANSGLPASVIIPTSDGGSIEVRRQPDGASNGFQLRNSAGAAIATGASANPIPMPDGTYLAFNGGTYDVNKLDGTLVRSVGGVSIPYGAVVVPNQLGGFITTTVDEYAGNKQVVYTKDVPAYTPANTLAGSAGIAANFATRPGVANDDIPLMVNPNPPPPPAPAPAPVVRGRASGGAIFDGIAGCDFTCAEAARAALAFVTADIMAQARRNNAEEAAQALATARAAFDAQLARQALDATVLANINSFRDAEIARQAARASGANAALDAQQKAKDVADSGLTDQQKNTAAVLALQRAAGYSGLGDVLRAEARAQAVAVYMVDRGELRRLVQGSRFEQMTPAQQNAGVDEWLRQEAVSQALGESTNARAPGEVTVANFVSNMSEAERAVWGSDLARRLASGEQF